MITLPFAGTSRDSHLTASPQSERRRAHRTLSYSDTHSQHLHLTLNTAVQPRAYANLYAYTNCSNLLSEGLNALRTYIPCKHFKGCVLVHSDRAAMAHSPCVCAHARLCVCVCVRVLCNLCRSWPTITARQEIDYVDNTEFRDEDWSKKLDPLVKACGLVGQKWDPKAPPSLHLRCALIKGGVWVDHLLQRGTLKPVSGAQDVCTHIQYPAYRQVRGWQQHTHARTHVCVLTAGAPRMAAGT